MTKSQLAALVERVTRDSTVTVIERHIDRAAEELAHELLRKPEFRAEMERLLHAAFKQALADLSQPAPPDAPESSS
jgi:hypothetical protein